MAKKEKRSLQQLMRSLHRDIGYLLIGLTLVYAISGVILIYRNAGFLRIQKSEEIQIEAGLSTSEIGEKLKLKRFSVQKEQGDTIFFRGGYYVKSSGQAQVTHISYPEYLLKPIRLHMMSGRSKVSEVGTVYGVLLTFLAVSGLFMYKFKSKKGRRGLLLTLGGIIFAIALLFFF